MEEVRLFHVVIPFIKCISKILANRLKSCLNEFITPSQITLSPGRKIAENTYKNNNNKKIAENVLLAQDLAKNYNRHGSTARSNVKVDLMKAYDSMEWDLFFIY